MTVAQLPDGSGRMNEPVLDGNPERPSRIKPAPVGEKFGSWEVLGEGPPDPVSGVRRWHVRCGDCGGTCVRKPDTVRRGRACVRCRNRGQRKRLAVNGGKARLGKRKVVS